jgi:hypothetical protein
MFNPLFRLLATIIIITRDGVLPLLLIMQVYSNLALVVQYALISRKNNL